MRQGAGVRPPSGAPGDSESPTRPRHRESLLILVPAGDTNVTTFHIAHERPSARLLVVDDDAFVREVLSRWLTDAGYECAQARDADEAWAYLGREHADLMTLDITMPKRSGMELLREVRKSHPDL